MRFSLLLNAGNRLTVNSGQATGELISTYAFQARSANERRYVIADKICLHGLTIISNKSTKVDFARVAAVLAAYLEVILNRLVKINN